MSVRSLLSVGILAFIAASSSAQVLVMPNRVSPGRDAYEIPELVIDTTIREQVAQTQVRQVYKNPTQQTIEAEYFFPLPEEGAVQDLVLLVDGKELPGRVLAKDEARKVYEEIVRKQRDPALLEYMGRGLFKTSVFPIPAGQQRTVTLKATFLCKRDRDLVQFVYPLSTQKHCEKPIGRLAMTVRIESKAAIKNIYSPSHSVGIERSGDHNATVKFEQATTIPTGDFRVLYALQDGQFGASVLSYRPSDGEDGYFLLLASPSVRQESSKPVPKTVILTLDRSGSMTGQKIQQAKEALRFVVNNLRDGDLFNIVAYESSVMTFKPELQRWSAALRDEALRFVDNIDAGGGTNINDALQTSMGMLSDRERPSYVLFLTDGLPTSGETNETKISENAKNANKAGARIFAFGVGNDVNARLLDRLSGGNGGISEYVKPEQNLEEAVSRFYSRLSSPVLTSIAVNIDGSDVSRTYPKALPDLFEGGQIVWVGRYKKAGAVKVSIAGKIGTESYRMVVDGELASAAGGAAYNFVERLWVMRRIGTIIDELDLKGQNRELVDELVNLSKKYGILTPYTSFLADEGVRLTDADALRRSGVESLGMLSEVSGSSGNMQRETKKQYMYGVQAQPAAPLPSVMGSAGGAGGASPAEAKAMVYNYRMNNAIATDKFGNQRVVDNVRQVGDKTFFKRDNRWVESGITPEEEAKAVTLDQFSDDYFKLARAQTATMNQYLAMPEELTVRLGANVYRIRQVRK